MITLADIMQKPALTKERIKLAYAIAIVADVLEFPITAAEMTILGAPGGEAAASFLDCVVMAAMTKVLGFHWAFVPSFLVEVVPGLDLLPTWVGCVAFVVWQRKKEHAQPAPLPAVIDVEDVTAVSDRPTGRLTAPPPLLVDSDVAIPAPASATMETAAEERLQNLSNLRDRKLISRGEYEAKRRQILGEI